MPNLLHLTTGDISIGARKAEWPRNSDALFSIVFRFIHGTVVNQNAQLRRPCKMHGWSTAKQAIGSTDRCGREMPCTEAGPKPQDGNA